MPKNSDTFARDVEIRKAYLANVPSSKIAKRYSVSLSVIYWAVDRVSSIIADKGDVEWLCQFSSLVTAGLVRNDCINPYKLDDYMEEHRFIHWRSFGKECCEELCEYFNNAYSDLGYSFGVVLCNGNKSWGIVRNDHPAYICTSCNKRYCKRRDEYIAFGKYARKRNLRGECKREVD